MQATVNNSKIKIVLLDFHSLFRAGIRALLADQTQFEILGEASHIESGISIIKQQVPDIALLDLNLNSQLNAEIIPAILEAAPHIKIILLTGLNDSGILQLAVQMGVKGIVQKTDSKLVLIKAIEKVHAGEVWIDRTMVANVLTRISCSETRRAASDQQICIDSISNREAEVITLVGEGLKNKAIANRLSISETTVRHHLTSVYSKLEVSDRLELAIFAYRHDLAKLPE